MVTMITDRAEKSLIIPDNSLIKCIQKFPAQILGRASFEWREMKDRRAFEKFIILFSS